jgi:hypothetical protein
LRYGIVCWGGDEESKTIFKLQKKLMRLITNEGIVTSCWELFKTLNLLPVPCMYIMEIVYYSKFNMNRFEQKSDRHDYNTRQRSDFKSMFRRTEIFKQRVNNMQIKLYNNLPKSFKDFKNIQLLEEN